MGMPIITQSEGTRTQAITDIITSVALEQAAIAHILNASGEEIQLAVANEVGTEELISLNSSVMGLLTNSAGLEEVLLAKLDAVLCPCDETEEE